jgi:hypothetical protein
LTDRKSSYHNNQHTVVAVVVRKIVVQALAFAPARYLVQVASVQIVGVRSRPAAGTDRGLLRQVIDLL